MSTPLPPDYPPIVYVLCAEAVDDPQDATVEVHATRDGRTALLAYSALDRLHDACGRGYPWVLVRTAGLEHLHHRHPFDLLLLDVVLPEHLRRSEVAR